MNHNNGVDWKGLPRRKNNVINYGSSLRNWIWIHFTRDGAEKDNNNMREKQRLIILLLLHYNFLINRVLVVSLHRLYTAEKEDDWTEAEMNAINLVSNSSPPLLQHLFLRLKIIIQNALIVVIMIFW